MDSHSVIGKKCRFGKFDWTIIDWNLRGCMLLCNDVQNGDYCFRQAWDRTYRIDHGEDVSWPRCELHDWLNEDFRVSTFSEEEAACIIDDACYANRFSTDQVGVFLLEKNELIKYTNVHIEDCWTLDFDSYTYGEDEVTYEKYVQPAIWIDLDLINSLLPKWKEQTE